MTEMNPPQERDANNPGKDRLHEWVNACLTELLRIAEQHQKELRLRRRDALLRNFRQETDDDFNEAGEEVTCCFHGRATREIPCQNRNYVGCPYRRDWDWNQGRERSWDHGR